MRILAGDIGGTQARLAIMEEASVLFERHYASQDFPEFEAVLKRFRTEAPPPFPRHASFAFAGVVENQRVKATNLPWVVDGQRLQGTGLETVTLLNDFEAAALGVTRLTDSDTVQIGGGAPKAGAPKAVLGAGTGLGEAILVPVGSDYQVLSSEGGHADFAPTNVMACELLRYLQRDHDHVSIERVLSGPGIVRIYTFLRDAKGIDEPADLARRMNNEDPAAVISETALENGAPLCRETMRLFCSIYGAEAGNLALKCLARGGVYVAGGIAPKILPLIKAGDFRASFEAKGRMAELLNRIPLFVVTHSALGLLGAYVRGEQNASSPQPRAQPEERPYR